MFDNSKQTNFIQFAHGSFIRTANAVFTFSITKINKIIMTVSLWRIQTGDNNLEQSKYCRLNIYLCAAKDRMFFQHFFLHKDFAFVQNLNGSFLELSSMFNSINF